MDKNFKFFKKTNSDVSRPAWLFFGCFLMFEILFVRTEIFDSIIFLSDKQDFAYTVIFLIYVGAIFYCFLNFLVLALSSDWKYKILYFLFFSVAVFHEYGYRKALDRFSTYSDIENVFSTNLGHKLSAATAYLNFTALLPCAAFLIILITVRTKQKPQKLKAFLGIFLLCAFFYIQLSFVNVYFLERKSPLVSIDSFCRSTTDFFIWGSFSNGLLKERTILKKPALAENYRPSNNIVFVIDESMRGDHLSLNGYERPTTPFLEELRDKRILHNWGIAAAATTGSHTTYDIMIAGLTPDDFPDETNFKLYTSPNIYQYAKAMNYKTYFFDGQMSTIWGGIPDDKKYIDSWSGVDKSSKIKVWDIDQNIAQTVNRIISSSTGNFIFIFKHGNHIPYQDNFPDEAKVWQPSYVSNYKFEIPPPEKLGEVVNAYDNCIKYNTDTFFRNLVSDYSAIPNNSVIIYTGDHGQTLYANGMASHGGKTREEANVPLFIIGNLGVEVDTNYKASHQNLFATILDLMNFPDDLRFRQYPISLLKAKAKDSKTRFFNPLKKEKLPFD